MSRHTAGSKTLGKDVAGFRGQQRLSGRLVLSRGAPDTGCESRMRWLFAEGDEGSGWRFLVAGIGLLALPWMFLGAWVLLGTPVPPTDPDTLSFVMFAYLLVSLLVSVVGAGCLIASHVLLVSAEHTRR